MRLLVLGANSALGFALARAFAREQGADVLLASRNLRLLARKARDLELRYGVEARALHFDARDFAGHHRFYQGLPAKPDVVVTAFRHDADQELGQMEFNEARAILETGYLGAQSILEVVAQDFAGRGSGVLIGLSSIAGARGRKSDYLRAAAAAAFTTYLSGLRQRLHPTHVRVMTVFPDRVRGRNDEDRELPRLLAADADATASRILKAFRLGRDIVYVNPLQRPLSGLIRLIPEFLYKRMKT